MVFNYAFINKRLHKNQAFQQNKTQALPWLYPYAWFPLLVVLGLAEYVCTHIFPLFFLDEAPEYDWFNSEDVE